MTSSKPMAEHVRLAMRIAELFPKEQAKTLSIAETIELKLVRERLQVLMQEFAAKDLARADNPLRILVEKGTKR